MRLSRAFEAGITAEDAFARGAALLASADHARPVTLYGASLAGRALSLGRFQRPENAIRGAAGRTFARRASGGPTIEAGEGIMYFALALEGASTLLPCPPDRVLNRNVRGFLTGLTFDGAPAHYFGRDFITLATRPAAFVGYARASSGAVLVEVLLGVRAPFLPPDEVDGYPPRAEARLRGKVPVCLSEVVRDAPGHEAVYEHVVAAHAKRFGLEVAATDPSDLGAAPALTGPGPEDAWSAPREVAIGFVSAGVTLDAVGRVESATLAGDIFMDEAAEATLRSELRGKPASLQTFARAVSATFAPRGPFVVDGVRELDALARALADAARVP